MTLRCLAVRAFCALVVVARGHLREVPRSTGKATTANRVALDSARSPAEVKNGVLPNLDIISNTTDQQSQGKPEVDAINSSISFPKNGSGTAAQVMRNFNQLKEEIFGLFANVSDDDVSLYKQPVQVESEGRADCWRTGNSHRLASNKSSTSTWSNSDAHTTFVTLASGLPQRYVEGMRWNRFNYLEKNPGHRYCEFSVQLTTDRPPAWSKVLALQAIMERASEGHVFIWLDADALMMELQQKFPPCTKDATFSTDIMDPRGYASPHSSINTGVFLIRKTEWTRRFLASVWNDYPQAIHDPWWDQKGVLLFRDSHPAEFAEHVEIVPYDRFNSIDYTYRPGDFVMHKAGGNGKSYDALANIYMQPGSRCCSPPLSHGRSQTITSEGKNNETTTGKISS